MGREEGGGFRMGNTCIPVADSFWKKKKKKLGIELPYDPAIPLLGIHTEETRIERDTFTQMFIAALFMISLRLIVRTQCSKQSPPVGQT